MSTQRLPFTHAQTALRPSPMAEVRDIRFDLSNVPRVWLGERRAVTNYFNNLSLLFPAGERFFMDSVRAHAGHLHDANLLAEVRTFNAQEAIHTREHRRYNDMLEKHGYPAHAMDARLERMLQWVRTRTPVLWQLAITAALEHFTAMMTSILLGHPRLLDQADQNVAALWRWHSAEESEHKPWHSTCTKLPAVATWCAA
jgi:uncharacterized protein